MVRQAGRGDVCLLYMEGMADIKRLAKPKARLGIGVDPGAGEGGCWAPIWQTSGPVPASRLGCLLVTWGRPIAKHFRIWYCWIMPKENEFSVVGGRRFT
jgi:hypothetical protein